MFAPEFVEDPNDGSFSLTGNTVPATTSIGTSNNALGINNQTIGNTEGAEGSDINLGESWVISFDQDVTITEFNFSSIDVGSAFQVSIAGGPTHDFVSGTAGDDFAAPFGSLLIAAGTEITVEAIGPADSAAENTNIRISEITVAVPEPGSALLLLAGSGLMAVRRRQA